MPRTITGYSEACEACEAWRHFVGAYLDWDAVRVRWRTLSSIFQSQWNSLQN